VPRFLVTFTSGSGSLMTGTTFFLPTLVFFSTPLSPSLGPVDASN
jgi:hypothetical protein